MWKGLRNLGLLPLAFLSLSAFSAHAQTCGELSSRQMMLSSQLREALTNSRQSMMELEHYYHGLIAELRDSLERQSGELTTLSDYLTSTMNSFRSLSAELQNSGIALAVERDRRIRQQRISVGLGIGGGIVLSAKLTMLILYFRKGTILPIPLRRIL